MYFTKTTSKKIVKNISKHLSTKYSQKLLDHAKKSATDAIKTSSTTDIQKTAEVTGDLIGNKIAGRSTKVKKSSQQNNPDTVRNENN